MNEWHSSSTQTDSLGYTKAGNDFLPFFFLIGWALAAFGKEPGTEEAKQPSN